MTGLFLKWTLRDLRARWVQVAAIALIIALGTGSFAAFNSMTEWRRQSNDASYSLVKVHDLRARLGTGAFLPAGALADAAASIESPELIEVSEERLIVPSQVEALAAENDVIVRGRLIGVDLSDGGPHVDMPYPERGRVLDEADAASDIVLLEYNFARHYELPESGVARLAGNHEVEYVGQATHPEYFMVVTAEGGFLAEANFAAVFTSIEAAGRLSGHEGMINDLVVRLVPGADRNAVQAELEAALAPMGASVMTIDDDTSYNIVIRDVEGDQQTMTVITFAILIGAVFAAFNLTARMVEAQRREIGIGMALGVPRWIIGIRPLMVAGQIAVLGTAFGIVVGYFMGIGLGSILREFLPIPVTETPFQFDAFVGAALIGVFAPLLAISYPVWRAVRVPPVEAIRTGHLASGGWGLAPLVSRLPIPGGSMARMPFRNIARSPRRTVLTALGIASAIAISIAIFGIVDSFLDAGYRSRDALAGDHPDRVVVELDTFHPIVSPTYATVAGSSALRDVEPMTRVLATLVGEDEQIDVFVDFVDFDSDLWAPELRNGELNDASAGGVVLSRKATNDLGVSIGESVRVRHPVRSGLEFAVVESDVPLVGTHDNAFRNFAYMDASMSGLMGLEGLANRLTGLPAAGLSETDVRRQLFHTPGVASVSSAAGLASTFVETLEEFIAIYWLMAVAALGIAALITFNSASIAVDERRREMATMFAFGVPVSRVLLGSIIENMILGIVATAIGFVAGWSFIQWLLNVIMPNTMPDLGAEAVMSPRTMTIGLVLGIAVVSLTPLLTFRRLRNMDVPSTLRVME